MVNNYWSNWIARLLPARCLICGMDAKLGQGLCADCTVELPLITHPCPFCALPLPTSEALACGDCLQRPPPYRQCVSALLYQPPASHLIAAFKFRSQLPVARLLSDLLRQQIGQSPQVDVILPVPLHWRRRWQRGFNQAETIADELSRQLHIPVQTRWLQRRHATPSQHLLNATQRAKNLRGAFALKHSVQGLRIALVDDVVTTGSTVAEVAQTLLRGGAASVVVWCLARTPRIT